MVSSCGGNISRIAAALSFFSLFLSLSNRNDLPFVTKRDTLYARTHLHGGMARTGSLSEQRGVPRSLHAARDTAVVLFYRRYYFSLAFRYCILVRPVYPFVCFHRPWPRIYYYYPERPARRTESERKGKSERERERGRGGEEKEDTTISRDVKRSPSRRISNIRGILARESSILHGGIGSPLPIARRVAQEDVQSVRFCIRTCYMEFLSVCVPFYKSSSLVKQCVVYNTRSKSKKLTNYSRLFFSHSM